MSVQVAIVWFRRDLRLADNPALSQSLQDCDSIIPLYIYAPDDEQPWQAGAASRWWLHESLQALDADLRVLGSRLIIRQAAAGQRTEDILTTFHGVTHIYWNRLYDPAMIARDTVLKSNLRQQGYKCHTFNAGLLYEPCLVANQQGKPYRVFTPFWKAIQKQGLSVLPTAAPKVLPVVRADIKTQALDTLIPKQSWYKTLQAHWQVGEQAAWQQLQNCCETLLMDYQQDRDYPSKISTSRLSPYLHFGEISPAQIVNYIQATMAQVQTLDAETQGWAYIRQIVWREFAHHLLFHFPYLTDTPMQDKFKLFAWEQNPDYLRRWQHGQTGFPLIDAGMRELWHTGWMHNRVRMLTGSFLTKNLRIHWLQGARWFWDTLLDADLANNTMGWQWIAGCGVDAAPYFRIFNPITQSEKFDAEGCYIRRWIPELDKMPAKYIHTPWQAPANILASTNITLGRDYPYPVVDLKQSREAALQAYQAIK